MTLYLEPGKERDLREEAYLNKVANLLGRLILAEENNVLEALPGVVRFSAKFTGLSDAQKWAEMLAHMCFGKGRAGFEELLVNAVEHGIGGMTYEEKKTHKRDVLFGGSVKAWRSDVEGRLKQPQNAGKSVTIDYQRTDSAIEICISDPGPGFDWKTYFDTVNERSTDFNGKGMYLLLNENILNLIKMGIL